MNQTQCAGTSIHESGPVITPAMLRAMMRLNIGIFVMSPMPRSRGIPSHVRSDWKNGVSHRVAYW